MFSHLDLQVSPTCLPTWLLAPHPLSLKLIPSSSTLLHPYYYHLNPGKLLWPSSCLPPTLTHPISHCLPLSHNSPPARGKTCQRGIELFHRQPVSETDYRLLPLSTFPPTTKSITADKWKSFSQMQTLCHQEEGYCLHTAVTHFHFTALPSHSLWCNVESKLGQDCILKKFQEVQTCP